MPPNKKRRISEVASKHTVRVVINYVKMNVVITIGLQDGGRSVKYDGSSYTFVEPFAQNLLCKRCSNFPVDPHQVTCQRLSLFCKSCVQHKELSCDCKSYPDSVSKEQIEKLKVECPNSASGCEWQGQLVAVANHQGSDCQKETVCCPYHDIGCAAEMLREKVKGHESEAREKHLECAMKTIVDMKQTDNIIRKKMTDLENLFHEKLAKQKEEHEMAIQTLKETISQCPPVVVKMTNFDDRSETLCVFDLIHNDKLFMSSNFYSRPREYKLCVVLKCLRKKFIMKLKVAALYQTECSHSWPLKGVAVVTVQPGDQDSLKLSIHFDIRAAPSDPNVDHISKEDGFQEFKIPREWQELAKLIPTPNITLKVETVELSSSSPLSEQLMTCAS